MSARPASSRRTRIVATLGPASWNEPVLSRMIAAGADVLRLNFSHGTHDEHGATIARVRTAEERAGRPVAILQDLGGPKIRIGRIRGGSINLRRGATLVLDPECELGSAQRVGISYPQLAEAMGRGKRLLLDDGRVELRVVANDGAALTCRVVRGDRLGEHKGVNAPGVDLPLAAMTPKDVEDLRFGVDAGVDIVAISFVRSADDVVDVRERIRGFGSDQPVIAKLERAGAIRNLDAILRASDGVMVARGDMAVEISPEDVPIIQKLIIARGMALGKPVITATQMLESMVSATRPSRAEASDVANAILDGTDAIMLSQETAIGQYPVEAIATMHRIARRTEGSDVPRPPLPILEAVGELQRAVARSAADLADRLNAACLIVFSQTGQSARYVSKCRPRTPALTVTTSRTVARRLQLLHGIRTVVVNPAHDTDRMLQIAENAAVTSGAVRHGERVVFVFGQPINQPGGTNTVKIHDV